MPHETLFRILLVALLTTGSLVRSHYLRQVRKRVGKAPGRESRLSMTLQATFYTVGTLLVLAYLAWPRLVDWAALPLPDALRWAGVLVGAASVVLLVRVHRALDANCSFVLSLREEHTLVTTGPYRWVRHPMYAVWFLLHTAVFLISANGLLGAWLIGCYMPPIHLRMNEEEALMAERFGEAYLAYKGRTGRILPRLNRSRR